MNTWKEQLIEYVGSLDDAISPENAEGLILSELTRIKEVFSNLQEAEKNDTVDNTKQLHKTMGMSESVTLPVQVPGCLFWQMRPDAEILSAIFPVYSLHTAVQFLFRNKYPQYFLQ